MTNPVNRRQCIKTIGTGFASVAVAGSGLGNLTVAEELDATVQAGAIAPKIFTHRGYLGWITDLATEPRTHDAWPSMHLDEALLRDYEQTFALMQRIGYNEITIWGLYVAHNWPVDIKSAVSKERGALVERLIDSAHHHGTRVLSGLGVYAWGFDEIIKAHPDLTRGDEKHVMCAHEPLAWDWMTRVVDFVMERFEIDGVSMQSADEGRCPCEICKVFGDSEYHARLNQRVAEYIRGRWPKKTIGVNTWGTGFGDPSAVESFVKLSKHVDYMIDSHNASGRSRPGFRRELTASLDCAFGTIGGLQVEPPQHWRRDRWFLPTVRRGSDHVVALANDRGTACEYFYHILANPGDELSFHVMGRLLNDANAPWEAHLAGAISDLYEVESNTRDDLAQLFLRAEDAYFGNSPFDTNSCGTIGMEPLVSSEPGPPVYLTGRLTKAQRKTFHGELMKIKQRAEKLRRDIPSKERFDRVIRCVASTISDIEMVAKQSL